MGAVVGTHFMHNHMPEEGAIAVRLYLPVTVLHGEYGL